MTAVAHQVIPRGDAGTRATLARMRQLVNAARTNPLVRQTAQRVIEYCPMRDDFAQARAIRGFLEQRIRFCKDPLGVELLHTPEWMLREIGRRFYVLVDCDDAAILGAALAKAVGLAAHFEALAFFTQDAPFQHVYALIPTRRGPVELDVTKSAQSIPPVISRRLTIEV